MSGRKFGRVWPTGPPCTQTTAGWPPAGSRRAATPASRECASRRSSAIHQLEIDEVAGSTSARAPHHARRAVAPQPQRRRLRRRRGAERQHAAVGRPGEVGDDAARQAGHDGAFAVERADPQHRIAAIILDRRERARIGRQRPCLHVAILGRIHNDISPVVGIDPAQTQEVAAVEIGQRQQRATVARPSARSASWLARRREFAASPDARSSTSSDMSP